MTAQSPKTFTIASWNVNSIKVRLEQVLEWLKTHKPDVLGLQETKTTDEQFPLDAFEGTGYHVTFSGQKTYNGVALISKSEPEAVLTDVPGLEDPQRRILAGTFGDVRVFDLYVPNGAEVGSDKYAYKLDWLDKLTTHIQQELKSHSKMILMGDFNIAPEDRDVYDPAKWKGQVLVSPPERAAFQGILDLGFEDTFRRFEQPEELYSWWNYRTFAFRRNAGLRIDHILASTPLANTCVASTVDLEPRKLERPSDHAPVVARFEL